MALNLNKITAFARIILERVSGQDRTMDQIWKFRKIKLAPVIVSAALLATSGCVNPPHPPDPDQTSMPLAASSGPTRPDVVTDLSSVSSSETAILPAPIKLNDAQPAQAKGKAPSRNEVVTQQLAATAPSTRYTQEISSSAPHGTQLLNDKARQFAEFSDVLLAQTMKAAQQLEPDKLAERRVRDDLNPVVLTAVMDSQGRLHEIVIEQHSGDLAVDRLFIEACKKGIWSRNPPLAARSADNNYRVRIQGMIYNSSFDRYGQYTYDTELGLALL